MPEIGKDVQPELVTNPMPTSSLSTVSVPSLCCPKNDGGCGRDYSFRVAIGPGPRRGVQRLFLECTGCGRTTAFVLADTMVNLQSGKAAGPLDFSGAPIKVKL